ncbi:MAG TPA: hypothetical protein PLJ37_00755 [Chitinophagales bacterium]|nr:hypothetical protein [Chitinophagales bacterium]HMW93481.1 hypothetical protein [Chitinophagales bacterium]HMZ92896.1 hypothetical protein [Chitinophagales bacterium]HNG25915.1 hypothetical protein [Chitinophagales bacterium]
MNHLPLKIKVMMDTLKNNDNVIINYQESSNHQPVLEVTVLKPGYYSLLKRVDEVMAEHRWHLVSRHAFRDTIIVVYTV